MPLPPTRRGALVHALAAALLLSACSPSGPPSDGAASTPSASVPTSASTAEPGGSTDSSGTSGPAPSADGEQVRVVAVGDVVCAPGRPVTPTTCQHAATADLTERLDPDLVVGLGDLQYEDGTPEEFEEAWADSWARFADRLVAVPGNHEWRGDLVGWRRTFDETMPSSLRSGAWGVYLLDATCDRADCDAQAAWLSDRLAEDAGRCQLVAWHQPRISSRRGSNDDVDAMWRAAVDGGADLVLTAHEHFYERFAPLDAQGEPAAEGEDGTVGTPQLVVGTGGKSLYGFEETQPGSEVRIGGRFGVLDLTLDPSSYGWRFVATDGSADGEELDSGEAACR